MSNVAFSRIVCALGLVPMILAATPAFAALGLGSRPAAGREVSAKDSAVPLWQLRVNGQENVKAAGGEVVTFRLRGALAGATAYLAIMKNKRIELLPFVYPDRNIPLQLKLRMPSGDHMTGGGFNVKVIGKTRDGTVVESNTVQILWKS